MTVDIKSIKDALFDNCATIAVSANDELCIIKDEICDFKQGDSISIYKFFDSIKRFIHTSDETRYGFIFDTERVARLLKENSRCIDPEFQLKVNGSDEYQPYQFAIVRSNGMNIIVIKRTDRFYNILENGMKLLSSVIEKMLYVDLTKDSYKEIKVIEPGDHPKKLSDWLKRFAEYNIAEDDQKDFLDYCSNMGNMYKGYGIGPLPKPVVYRRCKNTAEYRWSAMYAIPTRDYNEEHKKMFIYVIDIQDSYIIQAQKARRLGTDQYYDAMTGLHNKAAFQNRVARLHGQRVSLGYVGLKDKTPDGFDSYDDYMNFVVNEMVLEFGEDKCYRISDDEFVVLSVGTKTLNSTPTSFDNVYFGTSYSDGISGYSTLYDDAVTNAMM